jgi:hypothetical protein
LYSPNPEDWPSLPAVMSSIDESELNFLAVHASVCLRVRNPDSCVVCGGFLTRLLQQIINALKSIHDILISNLLYSNGKPDKKVSAIVMLE